jgi:hypothetical protein
VRATAGDDAGHLIARGEGVGRLGLALVVVVVLLLPLGFVVLPERDVLLVRGIDPAVARRLGGLSLRLGVRDVIVVVDDR